MTLKCTREGLEVVRFLPFIVFGNEDRGVNSSTVDGFSYPPLLRKRREHGK